MFHKIFSSSFKPGHRQHSHSAIRTAYLSFGCSTLLEYYGGLGGVGVEEGLGEGVVLVLVLFWLCFVSCFVLLLLLLLVFCVCFFPLNPLKSGLPDLL